MNLEPSVCSLTVWLWSLLVQIIFTGLALTLVHCNEPCKNCRFCTDILGTVHSPMPTFSILQQVQMLVNPQDCAAVSNWNKGPAFLLFSE